MRALSVALLLFIPASSFGEPEVQPLPPPPVPVRTTPLPPPAPLRETAPLPPPPPPELGSAKPSRSAESDSAPTPAGEERTVEAFGGPAEVEAPAASAGAQEPPAPVSAEGGKKDGKAEVAPAESAEFVKGELSNAGVDRLVVRRSRAILGLGYEQVARTQYAQAYPQLALRFGELTLAVGAPLNFEVFSSAYPKDAAPGQNHVIAFGNAGTLRKADWDEVSEYARVLTYLTYGKKEDRFYLDIGQTHVSTLGHGTIMRRYTPTIDINSTRVSAQVDAYNDHAGFEAMTNDILLWKVVGVLGFVKPLSFLSLDSAIAKSVSLGATVVVDRAAPSTLKFEPEPTCPVANRCAPASWSGSSSNARSTSSSRSWARSRPAVPMCRSTRAIS